MDPGEVKKVSIPVEIKTLHTTPNKGFGSEGVLRIHLLEAQNLIAKDNLMGGMVKGKSDPYVKINMGDAKFKSHVIKENLNPIWNEMYQMVVSGPTSQEIQFEVYDKDLDSDDFLGRFSIRLIDVIRSQYTDEWYTLKEVKSGRVHLVLEWVPTLSDPVRLDKVLQLQSLQSFQNKTVPSAALLFVFLERAHSLPWNETFYFLVRNPKQEMLIIKLSSSWDQAMGSLVVSVRELLSKPELVLDQWLNLDGASPQSQILLRTQLKVGDMMC
ncbi:extended synaptotagmin-1-like [Aplochiton taeniatus]